MSFITSFIVAVCITIILAIIYVPMINKKNKE